MFIPLPLFSSFIFYCLPQPSLYFNFLSVYIYIAYMHILLALVILHFGCPSFSQLVVHIQLMHLCMWVLILLFFTLAASQFHHWLYYIYNLCAYTSDS